MGCCFCLERHHLEEPSNSAASMTLYRFQSTSSTAQAAVMRCSGVCQFLEALEALEAFNIGADELLCSSDFRKSR